MSGSSNSAGKDQILFWFKENQNNISRILDIGAGSGTYYRLITDAGIAKNVEWIAIEAWKPYIEKFNLRSKYSKVINEDVRKIDWKSFRNIDVAIAGDVLEHMTKDEALEVVDHLLNISKTVIISIPVVHYPQDAVEGNPFEVHVKDDWSHQEVLDTWGTFIKTSYRKSSKSKVAVYWLSKCTA